MTPTVALCLTCSLFLFQQYIQWRYAIGEDRESLSKVSRVANEEDQKSLDAVHGVCPALPCTSAAHSVLFAFSSMSIAACNPEYFTF